MHWPIWIKELLTDHSLGKSRIVRTRHVEHVYVAIARRSIAAIVAGQCRRLRILHDLLDFIEGGRFTDNDCSHQADDDQHREHADRLHSEAQV